MAYDWIEIASDVVGFGSAVILAIATHNVLAARGVLHEARLALLRTFGVDPSGDLDVQLADLERREPARAKELIDDLARADARAGRFEPADSKMFRWGTWLLMLSFSMKLAFHYLK